MSSSFKCVAVGLAMGDSVNGLRVYNDGRRHATRSGIIRHKDYRAERTRQRKNTKRFTEFKFASSELRKKAIKHIHKEAAEMIDYVKELKLEHEYTIRTIKDIECLRNAGEMTIKDIRSNTIRDMNAFLEEMKQTVAEAFDAGKQSMINDLNDLNGLELKENVSKSFESANNSRKEAILNGKLEAEARKADIEKSSNEMKKILTDAFNNEAQNMINDLNELKLDDEKREAFQKRIASANDDRKNAFMGSAAERKQAIEEGSNIMKDIVVEAFDAEAQDMTNKINNLEIDDDRKKQRLIGQIESNNADRKYCMEQFLNSTYGMGQAATFTKEIQKTVEEAAEEANWTAIRETYRTKE